MSGFNDTLDTVSDILNPQIGIETETIIKIGVMLFLVVFAAVYAAKKIK